MEAPKNKEGLQPRKSSVKILAISFAITFGTILLLNIFGSYPWKIWGTIWRFWPAFLVIFLLQFVTRKSRNANLVATAFSFGILSALVFFSITLTSDSFNQWLTKLHPSLSSIRSTFGIKKSKRLSSQITVSDNDYTGVETQKIAVRIGAGRINIKDDLSVDYVATRSHYYSDFGKPELKSKLENGKLSISFGTNQDVKSLAQNAPDIKYDISIGHQSTPTQLEIITSAGVLNATLETLNLHTLNLQTGTGATSVVLGEPSLVNNEGVNITVGAGTLNLTLPYNTFVRINYSVGIGSLMIDSETLSSKSGSYTTPNFRITEDPLEINIKIGAGRASINTSGQN
jgi:predicted membrane protein